MTPIQVSGLPKVTKERPAAALVWLVVALSTWGACTRVELDAKAPSHKDLLQESPCVAPTGWRNLGPHLQAYFQHIDDSASPAPTQIAVGCAVGRPTEVPLLKQVMHAAGWSTANADARQRLATQWLQWSLPLADVAPYTTCKDLSPTAEPSLITSWLGLAQWALHVLPAANSLRQSAMAKPPLGKILATVSTKAREVWDHFPGFMAISALPTGAWVTGPGGVIARQWVACQERATAENERLSRNYTSVQWKADGVVEAPDRASMRLLQIQVAPDGTPTLPITVHLEWLQLKNHVGGPDVSGHAISPTWGQVRPRRWDLSSATN